MKLKEIIAWLEAFAPLSLAESYDFAGLVCGSPDVEVTGVLVCLNADLGTLEEAERLGTNFIIAHHPPLFRTLRTVAETTSEGCFISQAIRQGIAVYASHTNFDTASGGLTDMLTDRLQLQEIVGLQKHGQVDLYKLVVYTPAPTINQLREALFEAGAGKMGLYEDCGFVGIGHGTFKPMAGSNPSIGKQGVFEVVEEARLEVLVSEEALSNVLKALKKNHPYEEPAYDVIRLVQPTKTTYMGRLGMLPTLMNEGAFLTYLADRLGCSAVRTVGNAPVSISRIAIANGSYDRSLLSDIQKAACDALVTGDIKYHDALDLQTAGVYAVDAGHFYTEQLFVTGLAEMVRNAFSGIVVHEAVETDVYRYRSALQTE